MSQMIFICHIRNYTEYNEQWNVFSAFNPSKLEQSTVRGAVWGIGALLKSPKVSPQLWTLTVGFELTTLGYLGFQVQRSIHQATTVPWCLDPSLSPFLVKFTQILESILLDNPHNASVLLVGSLTCLDTALCEQPASLAMNVCSLPSLWRVSMIVFWTTVRSAVFPMIV